MAIKLSDEQVQKIMATLAGVSEILDDLVDDYDASEGVEGEQSLEQFLENPIARSIWYLSDIMEMIELAEKLTEANDNKIPA